MKRILALVLAVVLVMSMVACGGPKEPKISVFWYDEADVYLSSVRTALNKELDALGVAYDNQYAAGDQAKQLDQIKTAIAGGSTLLVVNVVTSGSPDVAKEILAAAGKIPVVFFNRAIGTDGSDLEILNGSYNTCFIGTDAPEAGHMQGKMVGEYVLANYEAIDINGDGTISYAMFKGQEGNMEADARTQYGVEDANLVLTAAGKPELKFYDDANTSKYLVDQNGAWSAAQGQEYMQTILSSYNEANGNMVELVIANNDDMALGAIAALQAAGYNKNDGGVTIPVFGVDATAAAQEAIAAKSMTGTIKQDAVGMANAVVLIAQNLMAGKPTFENVVGDLEGTWRVNIPYSAYSGE